MKHDMKVTMILVAIFLISQIVGLFFISQDIDQIIPATENQSAQVIHQTTAVGQRPEVSGVGSLIYIGVGVFIGTIILLLLAKFKAKRVWKTWYLFAVVLVISISLGVFLPKYVAMFLALGLALYKIHRPTLIGHNLTELLMYTGLGVLFVPLFDLIWVIALLLLISVYDMYAVWRSRHMVTMAKFTAESQLFAGLTIPYKNVRGRITIQQKISKNSVLGGEKNGTAKHVKKSNSKQAILGGGDVVFPLIFSGVVIEHLVKLGISLWTSYFMGIIISLTTAGSLWLLFVYAKKDKFYPAMPFISTGCFVGLGIIWLIKMLIV